MVDKFRDERGLFLKGCPGGPGNPYAKRVSELRSRLLDAITNEDWNKIVRQLVEDAQSPAPHIRLVARRELLDRTAGRAVQPVEESNEMDLILGETPPSAFFEWMRGKVAEWKQSQLPTP